MNELCNNDINKENSELKLVFYSISGNGALSYIRLLGPANQIGVKVINGFDENGISIDAIKEGNIIIIQRDACRELDKIEKIIEIAHKQNKPVVLDLDDQLFLLPENHPDRQAQYYTEALLPILQVILEADLVTVATLNLYNFILPFNSNVELIPNYLNDMIWDFRDPTLNQQDLEFIRIGYMGGDSHKPDINMVLPVLLNLIEEYGRKIKFQFWGIEPPSALYPYSTVDWSPPKSTSYVDFVKYFQTQHSDIVISPLCDNYFNTCKSPIKYFEYSALGIPGVYSNITPYSSVVTEGFNGLLAKTNLEWEKQIKKLIENPNLRIKIAFNAQENVKKEWLLSKNVNNQFILYKKTISEYQIKERVQNDFYPIIKSIAKQNYDLQQSKRKQIDEKELIIAKLTNDLKFQQIENKKSLLDLNMKINELDKYYEGQILEKLKLINELEKQIIQKSEIINDFSMKVDQKTQENRLILEKLDDCEQEIINYVTSKSWVFTRPFRRLFKILVRNNK